MKSKKSLIMAFVLILCCGLMVLGGCGETKAKISLESMFKTEYYVGDKINLDGGYIKYVAKNGDEEYVDITEEMISGFNTSTAGTKTLKIKYKGCEISVSYIVRAVQGGMADIDFTSFYYYYNPEVGESPYQFFKFTNTNGIYKLYIASGNRDSVPSNEMKDLSYYAESEPIILTKTTVENDGGDEFTAYYNIGAGGRNLITVLNNRDIKLEAFYEEDLETPAYSFLLVKF